MAEFESMGDILKKMYRSEDIQNAFVNPELNKDKVHKANTPNASARRKFFKVYEALVDELLNLSGMEVKVLLYLGMIMDYNKSRITMDSEFWKNFEEHFNASRQYLRRTLTSLKLKGFVYDDRIYLYVTSKYIAKRR